MSVQSFISMVVMLLLLLSGDVETNPGPFDHTVLEINTHLHPVKLAVLNAACKWKDIGRALGLPDGTIQSLDHGPDDHECLHRALSNWICNGEATIYQLLTALGDPTVKRLDIANQIRARKGKERINVGLDPDTETDVSNTQSQDDLKFSSSITSDELCSWLKQRSIDEEVVEGFKAQDVDGETFLSLPFDKEQCTKHLGFTNLTLGTWNRLKCLMKDAKDTKVEKPKVLQLSENKSVASGERDVKLSVTARGRSMKFIWHKGEEHSDASEIIENGGDLYHVKESHSNDEQDKDVTISELEIKVATPVMSGNYSCEVSNNAGTAQSGKVCLTVFEKPEIVQQPKDRRETSGKTNVNLTVTAKGRDMKFTWLKHGDHSDDDRAIHVDDIQYHMTESHSNDDHETTSKLEIKTATSSMAGKYSCKINNPGGTVSSESGSLTVIEPITIRDIKCSPEDGKIGVGKSASLTVEATGTSPIYKWFRNGVSLTDSAVYNGTTKVTLHIDKATTELSEKYWCEVSNEMSAKELSSHIYLDVIEKPEIVQQPKDRSVESMKTNVNLQVTAKGKDMNFTWLKYGDHPDDYTTISGEEGQYLVIKSNCTGDDNEDVTISKLEIRTATSSMAGKYSCKVYNPGGTISSEKASLTIIEKPEIVQQPNDRNVESNKRRVSLTVTAIGRNMKFNWLKHADHSNDDIRISGDEEQYCVTSYSEHEDVTVSKLEIKTATSNMEGRYSCDISNRVGTVSSEKASLTIIEKPKVVRVSDNRSVISGDTNVKLAVTAQGRSIKFKWRKHGEHFDDIKFLEDDDLYHVTESHSKDDHNKDMTTSNLEIKVARPDMSGNYSCEVSNLGGTAQSGEVCLTVIEKPEIVKEPKDRRVVLGGTNVNLTVTAKGSSMKFKWLMHGDHRDDDKAIQENDDQYEHVAESHPENIHVTTSKLKIKTATSSMAGKYSCEITNPGGNVSSKTASLTVIHPITIGGIKLSPEEGKIGVGKTASLTVEATGTSPIYKWFRNGVSLTDSAVYNGTTKSTLCIEEATVDLTGKYWCEVSNEESPKKIPASSQMYLEVIEKPKVIGKPENKSVISEETNVNLTVTAKGRDMKFEWHKHGEHYDDIEIIEDDELYRVIELPAIKDVSTSKLEIRSAKSDVAGKYSCEVSNLGGCDQSGIFCLTVIEPITIGGIKISPEDGKIGIGKSASLTVEATGSKPVYKWFKSGKPLVESTFYKGTTKATLHIEEVTADLTGDYWCEVSNVKSHKKVPTSSQVYLVIIDKPKLGVCQQPKEKSVTSGDTNVNLTFTAKGRDMKFKWRKHGEHSDDIKIIEDDDLYHVTESPNKPDQSMNVTTSKLQVKTATSEMGGKYSCEVSNLGGTVQSGEICLAIIEPITIGGITISLEDGKIGIGKSTSLTVEATGTNPVYKWFKSGKPLVESTFYKGTTKATLHIEEVTADLTGDYWCEVSNVKSPKKVPTSSQVFLDVIEKPKIIRQPENKSVVSGETNVNLTVTAKGRDMTFTWRKHGEHSDDIEVLDDGDLYHVTESSAKFDLRKDVTTSKLEIKSTTCTMAGKYSCELSNLGGSAQSVIVYLTVIEPIAIKDIQLSPEAGKIGVGKSAFITVEATGTSPVYKWFKSGKPLVESTFCKGTTEATLHIEEGTASLSGNYWCEVSNVKSPKKVPKSQSVQLDIVEKPKIVQQPKDRSVDFLQTNVNLRVIAKGKNMEFTWLKHGDDSDDDRSIRVDDMQYRVIRSLNEDEQNYTVTSKLEIKTATSDMDGKYSCKISNLVGTICSEKVSLAVIEPITLSSDIINFSRDHEEAVSACLTVEAMGTSPVYKWFRNEVPLTDSADFKDASCPTLCINKADLSGKYRCEVSNTRSKRARKTLTYHIEKPKIVDQPEVSLEGRPLKKDMLMSIKAKGCGPDSDLKFQWKKNGNNISNNDDNATVTTEHMKDSDNVKSSLRIKHHSDMDGRYSCDVCETTNPGGIVQSREAVFCHDQRRQCVIV